ARCSRQRAGRRRDNDVAEATGRSPLSFPPRSHDESTRRPEQLLEVVAVRTARGQTRAILEDDEVVALEERLEQLDALDAHDRRPVDAYEARGVEALLEVVHRLAQQVDAP